MQFKHRFPPSVRVFRREAGSLYKEEDFMKTSTKLSIAAAAMTGLLAGATSRSMAAASAPAPSSAVSSISSAKTPASADVRLGTKTTSPAAPAAKHDCKGMNDCKGQGGCQTGDKGCKGKNTCKGKGGCSTN